MTRDRNALARTVTSLATRQYHSAKNFLYRPRGPGINYRQFHSQFGEDRFVFENVDLPARGTFVDVGAGHPFHLSNTYFFERNGWTGLCVDADPRHYELLKQARANVEWAAVAAEDGECEFSQSYLPAFSTTVGKQEGSRLLRVPVKNTIKVPAFRLETLLEKHEIGRIDLLDIDIEGTEVVAWKSFKYEQHQPRVVIIEFETFGLATGATEITELFADLPYELVHTTCTNFVFVHR